MIKKHYDGSNNKRKKKDNQYTEQYSTDNAKGAADNTGDIMVNGVSNKQDDKNAKQFIYDIVFFHSAYPSI